MVHRNALLAAAAAERAASELSGGADGGVDDAMGIFGAAAAAAASEALEPLPLSYLPSVGALLLMLAAVGAHVLLGLGKRWSVGFHTL